MAKQQKNKRKKAKTKKILDGVDLSYNSVNDNQKKEPLKIQDEDNFSEKKINGTSKENHDKNFFNSIQNFISIIFTIIIFIALILLILVLYNNYFKKEQEKDYDVLEICKDYIEKDYGITDELVEKFIKFNRGIFYSLDNFNNINLTSTDLNNFIIYYIWNLEGEYIECGEEEANCLVSKKEITYDELEKALNNYLNIKEFKLNFDTAYSDSDNIRLYQENNKIILTFSEFTFKTYKHDLIDITIDEDNVKVVMALSNQINDHYSYIGSKIIELQYINKNFVIKDIRSKFID